MVGGFLRANLKLIEVPLNCQGVRVNSYGYSLAKTFSCEYLLMKLFFSLSFPLELWIMLSHLFKWDICFVQAVSGTLVTWCCALMIGLLLPFGNKSCFLMFCINVVSCYTELTRKGMLLTVLNGKKGGNSNFLTGIQPVTFSDFDLVVWEPEIRKVTILISAPDLEFPSFLSRSWHWLLCSWFIKAKNN